MEEEGEKEGRCCYAGSSLGAGELPLYINANKPGLTTPESFDKLSHPSPSDLAPLLCLVIFNLPRN